MDSQQKFKFRKTGTTPTAPRPMRYLLQNRSHSELTKRDSSLPRVCENRAIDFRRKAFTFKADGAVQRYC